MTDGVGDSNSNLKEDNEGDDNNCPVDDDDVTTLQEKVSV